MTTDAIHIHPVSFWSKHRTLILIIAIVLLMPPLAAIVQLTGDVNFCGRWCPRMFFVWREGTTATAFLMGFVRSYVGVALVVAILGTTLAFGRYWCSHICPVASPLELGSRLVPTSLKLDFSFNLTALPQDGVQAAFPCCASRILPKHIAPPKIKVPLTVGDFIMPAWMVSCPKGRRLFNPVSNLPG